MTRTGLAVLGAAGFAALMSFSSSFSMTAQAAVLGSCQANSFKASASCCESIKRKPMTLLNYGHINCQSDVECKLKKGKKSCYVEVKLRDPHDRPDTPKEAPDDKDNTESR